MAICQTCKKDVDVPRNSVRVIRNGVTNYYCTKKCMNIRKRK